MDCSLIVGISWLSRSSMPSVGDSEQPSSAQGSVLGIVLDGDLRDIQL
ncbi:hypothetical protein F441_15218 [Phytophthora nicotianae CJ01A1]|uniref:Uncharacterized protein n=3 Tax=Phytophthora nicotianae TaxID=4792 RepID=W2MRJ7_PHYNI|nr:hypothetical protein L915_14948 [Phytophthora nicotianae]ETL32593.1 hypothetical protein L916_14849 [Phytophthora nicotianae]ETM39002.1 hypothetical protein L914_14800 [Phytophthora nicotianae]ETO67709.1 hypothetical protein F444_15394 [Phytophthora nicotianae P1976]ETP08869.1 hypothetical protein F441_15218 [Phytophthora nicotianae CJ01A1]